MSRAKRSGRPWTAADGKKLRALAAARMSARLAAKALGRTTGAVKFKAMVEEVHFKAINQPRGVQRRLARRRARFGMRATLKAVRR